MWRQKVYPCLKNENASIMSDKHQTLLSTQLMCNLRLGGWQWTKESSQYNVGMLSEEVSGCPWLFQPKRTEDGSFWMADVQPDRNGSANNNGQVCKAFFFNPRRLKAVIVVKGLVLNYSYLKMASLRFIVVLIKANQLQIYQQHIKVEKSKVTVM